ncbi:hypothetical protein [Sneathiella sp.]|uniref:hypothetical protein n=1 Tax=Sneathiella sp. TaxID=1964365 RepID=UPI002FE0B2B7
MKRHYFLLLFLAGAGLIGWAAYDYSTSGREAVRFELQGPEGSTPLVRLDPAMNPMRALLDISYEIELREESNPAFEYSIILVGPGGLPAFTAEGVQRDKREDNAPEYASRTAEQVITDFDVPAPGDYLFDWRITPEKATISAQAISLRRNVTPLRLPLLIAGVACFAVAVLALLLTRKKRS